MLNFFSYNYYSYDRILYFNLQNVFIACLLGQVMTEIGPKALLEFIDREKLDDLGRLVYDGARRMVELCNPTSLCLSTSDNYQ